MKIGVIGAGYVGRALATLARGAKHEVMIANSREPATLASTAMATDSVAGTAEQAAQFGEVVVIAVPFCAIDALPVEALAGRIVIDANNYYPQRDGAIAALNEHRTTTSELLAERLPGARVVKAFNAIRYNDLERDGRPAGAPGRRALPIAGDDGNAKAAVARLVDELGFDPYDAGSLAESWRFERAKPAYCVPLDRAALADALARAEREKEVTEGSWRASRPADDYTLGRIVDRARISDLIARYCRALDRLDLEGIRQTYHPDANDNHGFYNGNVDGFIEWVRERHRHISFSMHAMQTMLITFTGDDRAVVETYVTAVQKYAPEGKNSLAQLSGGVEGPADTAVHLMVFGRYVDEVEQRGGEWRFRNRHVVYDSGFLVDESVGPATVAGEGWLAGRRDQDDTIFQVLKASGD